MAGVLARMEAMGLVTKERFEDDQRRVRVSLTKQSVNLVRMLSKDLEAEYLALECEVGTEAVERVYRAANRRFSVRTDIPLKRAIPCTSRSGCGISIGARRTLALG